MIMNKAKEIRVSYTNPDSDSKNKVVEFISDPDNGVFLYDLSGDFLTVTDEEKDKVDYFPVVNLKRIHIIPWKEAAGQSNGEAPVKIQLD